MREQACKEMFQKIFSASVASRTGVRTALADEGAAGSGRGGRARVVRECLRRLGAAIVVVLVVVLFSAAGVVVECDVEGEENTLITAKSTWALPIYRVGEEPARCALDE